MLRFTSSLTPPKGRFPPSFPQRSLGQPLPGAASSRTREGESGAKRSHHAERRSGGLGGDCPVGPETDASRCWLRRALGLSYPTPIERQVDTAPSGRYLQASGGGGELQLPVGSWSSPPDGPLTTPRCTWGPTCMSIHSSKVLCTLAPPQWLPRRGALDHPWIPAGLPGLQ